MSNSVQMGLSRWANWQMGSVNRRVFAAMATVGGMTVLVKLASMVKEVFTAYAFGTSDAMDAFLMAFLLPQFAIYLIGGTLNAALIPTYIEVREREGKEAAQQLLSSVMVWTSVSLIVASMVLASLTEILLPRIASGFDPDKLQLTRSLYYVLLVTLVISGLGTMWSAILNAWNRFALAAAIPIVTSSVTVALVVTCAKQWGAYVLAIGIVGGALIETLVLGWGLRQQGVSLAPRWHGLSPAVKQVLAQYAPMVAGAFLMGSGNLVSQSMAAMLGSGVVSALAYGSKITNMLLGVAAVAVSTAVLPHFSQMVAEENWPGVRHTVMTYARLLLLICLPVTAVLMYFSEPLIILLFQRGAFTAADSQVVGQVQVMYLLQVPPYVVSMLFVRLISALKSNHLMMWGCAINLILTVALTYYFMHWLDARGIALATSLVYMVSLGFLMTVSLRSLKKLSTTGSCRDALKETPGPFSDRTI